MRLRAAGTRAENYALILCQRRGQADPPACASPPSVLSVKSPDNSTPGVGGRESFAADGHSVNRADKRVIRVLT